MACGTSVWNIECFVVWINRQVIVCLVAPCTSVWSIGISVGMALTAISCCVRTGKRIRIIMVKSRWYPSGLRMATFAGFGKLRSCVIRLGSLIIISSMATIACFRRIGIITIVTGSAIIGYSDMSTSQSIISIMNRESSGLPAWICRMTGCTSLGYIKCNVIWISRLVIISLVASRTGIRSVGITIGMALRTISYGCMCTGKRVRVVMVKSGRNPCCLRMTALAGFGKLQSSMIRLSSLIIINCMASITSLWRIGIITIMTGSAIIGYCHMGSGKSVISIVSRERSRLPTGICRVATCTIF
jgi:hypothetical protein